MTKKISYFLRAPADDKEWQKYHAIRRKVLFENRGLFGVYDETHPDDFAQNNYPLFLIYNDEPVGVIRIDVEGKLAIFRRVAIREDVQRSGYGKEMILLAEGFARSKGCNFVKSYVSPEAVGFYEKCGFNHDASVVADARHIPMYKKLVF